jgi:hypothetical protein
MEEESKKEETQAEDEKAPQKPLDKMTVKELREIALGIEGITGVHAMKKEELLNAVKEAKGIVEEEPAKETKKAPKVDGSVGTLKQKIVALKKEKEAARKSKDKKKVDIYRRRINRLKKKTRKAAQA